VALTALDARLHLHGPEGGRRVRLAEFYLNPGSTPWRETVLSERELITAVECPSPAPHSAYVKIRDRAAFEFALVSAAAVVRPAAGGLSRVALALGGVAPRPWRLPEVEDALSNRPLTRRAISRAVDMVLSTQRPLERHAFKLELARRTAERALLMAAGLI
jgi:xanthine dehydrogenase YagS FAD-binding subunit